MRLSLPWLVRSALLAACGIVACGRTGDLSVEQLSQVVDRERPTLKACYDAALEKNPYRHEVRMQAVIQIAPTGNVTQVEVEEGGGLPGMEKCIREAIEKWQFPAAEAETHTSLPIIFTPEVAGSD